jgi:flagellar protein FlgJ
VSAPKIAGVSGSPASPASHASHEVAAHATHATLPQLRAALARATQKVTGQAPTARFLDVLTAQAAVETGRGEHMYNWNFGGIKGAGPSGGTTTLRTKEILDGKEVEIRDGFRAYGTIDEGAVDYVALLQRRFGSAVSAAQRGDVDGFAHALKRSGYYTADADDYAAALRGIAKEVAHAGPAGALSPYAAGADGAPLGAIPSLESLPEGTDFATSDVLGRVLDAVRASTARIAEPVET